MTQGPRRPASGAKEIAQKIVKYMDNLTKKDGKIILQNYPIRELVEHAEEFGPALKAEKLQTNQVRKFLDAINQIKNSLTEDNDFSKIETSVVLLKPKLVYAAGRQPAAKPLSDVLSAAIDKVHSTEDFKRLVQLIESIIAYHKGAGGE